MEKTAGSKKNYNFFHKSTNIQSKIISKKNYTYRFLLETLNKYPYEDKKVLDIGCGAGTIDYYLAKNGAKVLGVDISEKAIDKCKESTKILGLERSASFKVVDFPRNSIDQKFDIIICSEVLEHIKNDKLAIEKIKKMLKHDSILVISVPSRNAPLYKWGLASSFDNQVGHLRRYSPADLATMLENAGLMVISVKKVEGLLRNFLFLNQKAGKLIRFLKSYLSDLATLLDKMLIPIFGESNIIVVAKLNNL